MKKQKNNEKRKKLKVLTWIIILGIAVIGAIITYLICAKFLASLAVFSTIVGIGLSIYAYFIEKSSMGNLAGAILAVVGLIGTLITVLDSNKPIQIDFDSMTEFVKEREKLKEEIELRNKTIAALNEELARKNRPAWEQIVRDYLEKGELQKAIESIDPNLANNNEEAAQKHIRKAQLYITNFQFAEAEQHYKQAVTIFPSYDNNRAIANFYFDLNKFPEAKEYYNNSLSLVTSPKERADALHKLGRTQWKNNAHSEAMVFAKEALKIRKELANKNPDIYLPDVAETLNLIGVLQSDNKEYFAAEASYKEALEIRREFAKKNRDAYLPDVALTLNNLGNLQLNKNEYFAAEASYKEALKIYRELADKNRDAYLPNVAMILNNLGILQKDKKEYFAAEASYKEALKIYRELADKNQDAYLPDVAMTLNNLGNLQSNNKG